MKFGDQSCYLLKEQGRMAVNFMSTSGPATGQILQERYQLQSVLGIGGMGTVYKGVHLGLNRAVASNCFIRTSWLTSAPFCGFDRKCRR
jgi:hypothetical protein